MGRTRVSNRFVEGQGVSLCLDRRGMRNKVTFANGFLVAACASQDFHNLPFIAKPSLAAQFLRQWKVRKRLAKPFQFRLPSVIPAGALQFQDGCDPFMGIV